MDRFTLAVVGGVLALVATGLVAAAVVRGHSPQPDLSTPSGVVLAYALAEQRGDGQAAWELLATTVQVRTSRDQFLVRFGNRSRDRQYVTVEDERLDAIGSSGASVVLVRTYPDSGGLFGSSSYTNRTTVRLTEESSGWRITVPPDPYLLTENRP
jgi:hypothetical protein